MKKFGSHFVLLLVLLALFSTPALIYSASSIGPKAMINTIAGTTQGFSGDNGPAILAQLNNPAGVALDKNGNIYIADAYNHRIRKVIAATGIITTVAGMGSTGFSGDDGPATAAQLNGPIGVSVDQQGHLYIVDQGNNRIRKVISPTGVITTIVGTGVIGFFGDGGPATEAQLSAPYRVTLDEAGNLYIADGANDSIRKVISPTGIITTIAGIGLSGFSGDGGLATNAQLNVPVSVVVDKLGNLYIADNSNHRIRKVIAATGVITTVAGMGSIGFSGDNGLATAAQLQFPSSVAVDKAGNLYIADEGNHRVRRVDAATGLINTIVGTGSNGFSGDGGLALAAELSSPTGIAFDSSGNLYIADLGNHRIRKVENPKTFLPVIMKS
jgi:sugar lactone lactonase YvrE